MHYPHVVCNWLGMLISIIALFIFGGIWYGPLLGKKWAKEMGMNLSKKPPAKVMRRAFLLQFLGLVLTSFVLSFSVQDWRPSAWGISGMDQSKFHYGYMTAFFIWVGFYVPMQLAKVSWEGRSWKLFFINTSYDFLSLQFMCQILSHTLV